MSTASPFSHACFRFHGELNAFLPVDQRGRVIDYAFKHHPGIKDPIEALGVPHTEVMALTVNGAGSRFDYQLRDGDQVEVYPVFEDPNLEVPVALRAELANPGFVLDVHLGKLAKILRLLGQDTLYRNDFEDAELVDISEQQNRVLLTRDRRLLFHRRIVYGHYLFSTDAMEQARNVIRHYQLAARLKPFTRCVRCNGRLYDVSKTDIINELEPKTKRYYQHFYRCVDCGQIYWRGSHFRGIMARLAGLGAI